MQLTIVQTLVLLCTVALIPQDANSTDILTLNQWLVFSNQYEHNVESLVFLILREGMKLITSQDRNYNICCNRENRTRTWQRVWHNRKGRTAGQEGDHSSDYLWPGPVDWMHTGAVGTWSTSAPLMSSRRKSSLCTPNISAVQTNHGKRRCMGEWLEKCFPHPN